MRAATPPAPDFEDDVILYPSIKLKQIYFLNKKQKIKLILSNFNFSFAEN